MCIRDSYPALVVFYGREGGLSIGRQLLASDGLHGPKKDALGHTWDRYYGGTERAELEFWVEALLDGKNPIVEERTVLKPGLYKDDARNDGLVEELDAEGLASIAKGARDLNAVWVVKFYSDRCPHCKTLVPEMISAAEKLRKSLGKTQVRVAAINARVFFEASEEHGVAGLPWVTGWYDGQRLEDMAGLSDAQSVVRWGTRMHQTKWKRKAGDAPEDDDVPDDGLTPTCRNADICTCSNDPPTCRCAPSAYSRGCCNMNCGDCGDLCAALSGKKKKKPKEPPVVEKKDAAKKEPPVVEKWPGKWEKKDAVAVDAAGGAAAAPAANGTAWREALGAHTWFYLHTFAAKYPDAPTEADKVAARWQVASLAQHYPCHVCRGHLQKKLLSKALGPVDVDGAEGLGQELLLEVAAADVARVVLREARDLPARGDLVRLRRRVGVLGRERVEVEPRVRAERLAPRRAVGRGRRRRAAGRVDGHRVLLLPLARPLLDHRRLLLRRVLLLHDRRLLRLLLLLARERGAEVPAVAAVHVAAAARIGRRRAAARRRVVGAGADVGVAARRREAVVGHVVVLRRVARFSFPLRLVHPRAPAHDGLGVAQARHVLEPLPVVPARDPGQARDAVLLRRFEEDARVDRRDADLRLPEGLAQLLRRGDHLRHERLAVGAAVAVELDDPDRVQIARALCDRRQTLGVELLDEAVVPRVVLVEPGLEHRALLDDGVLAVEQRLDPELELRSLRAAVVAVPRVAERVLLRTVQAVAREELAPDRQAALPAVEDDERRVAVSYTHLTLPTKA